MIGAIGGDPNGIGEAGETYVVFGMEGVFSGAFDLTTLDGSNGFIVNGSGFQDTLGSSLSSAGDINGDGFGDIVINANNVDVNGKIDAGATYVVFGMASGFNGVIESSNLNGINGFFYPGY